MKKVLFIGITNYNFRKEKSVEHLKSKFAGLSSSGLKVYVVGRGVPFYKNIWGCKFFLLPNRFFYWLGALKLAFWLCLFCGVDVIIAQSPLLEGFLGVLLKKLLRKELIVEVHGDFIKGPFLNKKRFLPKLQKKLLPRIVGFSLKNADKIRAISEATKKQAMSYAVNKPFYIFPTFTNIDDFLSEPLPKLGDYILFVGALEKVKGVEYLLDAISQMYEVAPHTFIVGEGSERGNLEKLAKDLDIADRVRFLGRLSLEETRKVMAGCYCLVLPSLSEGLGRVLLEAGALGKPLIGSNVGGIPDIIKNGQTGFLIEPGNNVDLKNKLTELFNDKEKAIQMGKNSREFVKDNFSNAKYISSYIAMINI